MEGQTDKKIDYFVEMNSKGADQTVWQKLKRNKGAFIGLIVIGLSIFTALFGYWLAPDSSPYANRMILEIGGRSPGFTAQFLMLPAAEKNDPTSMLEKTIGGSSDQWTYLPIRSFEKKKDSIIVQQFVDDDTSVRAAFPLSIWEEHGSTQADPVTNKRFLLGTDKYGRDILSRLIIGVRVSLGVGFITVLISLSIGVLLGAIAGYYRGRVDQIITWFINVIWSIPTLLLVFAFTLLLGKGFWQVFVAIGLTMWVNVARIVRGQLLKEREMEYVEAAKALGYSNNRILFRHILPNIMGPVWVVAASNFASAIVIEAGLSFLGIGVQPPQPSWGLMIKENFNFIITHNPMLALAPGFAIMILVLAFNLVGNGLRDALAVK